MIKQSKICDQLHELNPVGSKGDDIHKNEEVQKDQAYLFKVFVAIIRPDILDPELLRFLRSYTKVEFPFSIEVVRDQYQQLIALCLRSNQLR